MTDSNAAQAIQEGERNAAADQYFKARAWVMDTNDNRRIFEAGFDRAYALLSKLRAEGVRAGDGRVSLRGAANLAFNALHECKPVKGAEKQYSDAIQALQSALHDIAYTVNRTATAQQFSDHLQREARAALASAPVDPEAAEVDFLVQILEKLETWSAEEWNELIERRPAILALLRPLVMASAPVADESPMAKMADALREKGRQERQAYQDSRVQSTEWGPMPHGTEADLPASAPVALSETERSAITGLIAVARAAFNVADDAEDDGAAYQIKVLRTDAGALGAALDTLDELPDDQPGYAMGPSNKAEWALRRLLDVASAPVAVLSDADIREVFLAHGFTIKDGQADLKPYVYEAARALIAVARIAADADKALGVYAARESAPVAGEADNTDYIGLALELESAAKRVESQTVQRAIEAGAHGLRLAYSFRNAAPQASEAVRNAVLSTNKQEK